MDFVGPSDHNEVLGGRWPDSLRDYQWWYAQKLVDVYTHEPKFWGIYSYEHSMSRPGGHRNVLYLRRGGPLRPIDREKGLEAPDNTPRVMWTWMRGNVLSQGGQKMVVVPHTFAASDEIYVKATAGGHMVGEGLSASVSWPPEIVVEVEGQDEILRIDVVKDGKYVFSREPRGTKATLSYRDAGAELGES